MANPKHVELLRNGAWNQWRETNKRIQADLAGADLSGQALQGANLTDADLTGAVLTGAHMRDAELRAANLTRADLREADLPNSNLREAKLHRANLTAANLLEADLAGADLSGADLSNADLTEANLRAANLTGAELSETVFSFAVLHMTVFGVVNLGTALGLQSCVHRGPSVIDHNTLALSGQLPLVFLRGCGLPERLFDYLPSLLEATPIQFYSCFLSYASENQDFANRIYKDLQSAGVRCWFAPHDMQPGQKIHEQIDEAIRVYDRLLLILSLESMTSEWVATEIAKARKKEATQKRQVLFPISIVPYGEIESWELFDADRGKDSAREIREYFIPNFSQWKDHDTYTKSFNALLKALKTVDAQPSASV